MITDAHPPVHFESLPEAVDFIAACVETDRAADLFARCAHTWHGGQSDSAHFSARVFPLLRRRHDELNIRQLYAGREFPADRSDYKLGGHAAELGYLHIDFVKQAEGWVIDDIWECR